MNARERFAADISSATDHWELPIIGTDAEKIAVELEEKGYSKPRTINTVVELDALPRGSVVLDRDGLSLHLSIDGWSASNGTRGIEREELERETFPATVIHEPAA